VMGGNWKKVVSWLVNPRRPTHPSRTNSLCAKWNGSHEAGCKPRRSPPIAIRVARGDHHGRGHRLDVVRRLSRHLTPALVGQLQERCIWHYAPTGLRRLVSIERADIRHQSRRSYLLSICGIFMGSQVIVMLSVTKSSFLPDCDRLISPKFKF